MGKQRFRLSHMIPNAWFYRLRDMNALPHNNNNHNSLPSSNNHPSNSFCHTPKLHSSPSTINKLPKHVLGSIYIRPTESTHTDQDLFLSPSTSPLFETKRVQDSSQYPQIITKSKENEEIVKENIACKRVVHDENKFSSGCCIVKSTFEPSKDLKESMMEMIVDYNIRASQDLEKLLAFYLSLNSNEYHDMIVKAFEEIWLTFDFLV